MPGADSKIWSHSQPHALRPQNEAAWRVSGQSPASEQAWMPGMELAFHPEGLGYPEGAWGEETEQG